MIIKRENDSFIKKVKINFNNLDEYDEKKIKKATSLLNDTIDNSYICQFENIECALQNEKNSSFCNKNSGCISQIKKLKKKLKSIEIKTFCISCKANGFSNPAGDFFSKGSSYVSFVSNIKKWRNLFYNI